MRFMNTFLIFKKLLDEAYRVLKKGGYLLFTAPFTPEFDKSVVRVKIKNGEIIYLMEKEIHGNPLSEEGSLAFYNPGWDIMNMQKEVTAIRDVKKREVEVKSLNEYFA